METPQCRRRDTAARVASAPCSIFRCAARSSTCSAKAKSPAAKIGAVLTEDRRYPDPSQLVTLLDNHTICRASRPECGGDLQKVSAALQLLYALRGVPSIIWGTEEGFTGQHEPQNRASMRFDDTQPLFSVIAKAQALRRAHPSLGEGATQVIVAADENGLTLLRVAAHERATIRVAAQRVNVTFERGNFVAEAARARRQWLTGEHTRHVAFSGPADALVVGSGPELGSWKTPMPLPAQADLPVGGVFELKLLTRAKQWEKGPNRVLFVAEGSGPLEVSLTGRGT